MVDLAHWTGEGEMEPPRGPPFQPDDGADEEEQDEDGDIHGMSKEYLCTLSFKCRPQQSRKQFRLSSSTAFHSWTTAF